MEREGALPEKAMKSKAASATLQKIEIWNPDIPESSLLFRFFYFLLYFLYCIEITKIFSTDSLNQSTVLLCYLDMDFRHLILLFYLLTRCFIINKGIVTEYLVTSNLNTTCNYSIKCIIKVFGYNTISGAIAKRIIFTASCQVLKIAADSPGFSLRDYEYHSLQVSFGFLSWNLF